MKKLLLLVLLLWMLPFNLEASFYAVNPNGYGWSYFELRQLDCDVQVFGLFYETTITFEIRLTTTQYSGNPYPGAHEVIWDFSLVDGAVMTDCWIQPYGQTDFIRADITDLSSAEQLYNQYPNTQPRVLLRHRYERNYDGSLYKRFQMRFSPVTLTQGPKIKIRYLLPCVQRYAARRVQIPLNEFNVYKIRPANLRLIDHDNPETAPQTLAGDHVGSWQKVSGFWTTIVWDNYNNYHYYDLVLLNIAAETANRSYLRTFAAANEQFYQLSIAPPLKPDDRQPKNILLAIDYKGYTSLFDQFEQAVRLSASESDSITMLYSAFVPEIYDSSFVPVTGDVITRIFKRLNEQSHPQINTLPHLLKQAVNVFNLQNKAGELWLLTDANAHSDPPETALEIISQTLAEANKPVVFRIISADFEYWPYRWLNGKSYVGNDYLYENLARLSWGSFIELREFSWYDYLDAMLDAVCPTANAVEVDAEPAGGITYSRFQFNQGRVNFPLTLPYYEIGLFDGGTPFTANFYGLVDGDLFAKEVAINPAGPETDWGVTETFWYEQYVQNLLLEPQSYATISYIEDISVQKRILTPYSGFIVPGPDGQMAFTRLSAETITSVQVGAEEEPSVLLPEEIKLSAYPNPFNAATKLRFDLPSNPDLEQIEIRIVNLLGQAVRAFDLPVNSSQSSVEWQWDGRNDRGLTAASGIYIVLARMGTLTQNIKITLVK